MIKTLLKTGQYFQTAMWRKVDFSFFRDNKPNPSAGDTIIWIALTALVCGQTPEGNLILTDGLLHKLKY